jgi:DNA-binding transcriptional ArsR family regulator
MAAAKLEAFEMETVELAAFARALSHPARIEILKILGQSGELACMAIVRHLPLSQPACSRHIHELLRAGLLSSRTIGSNVFFKLNQTALKRFCSGMNQSLNL